MGHVTNVPSAPVDTHRCLHKNAGKDKISYAFIIWLSCGTRRRACSFHVRGLEQQRHTRGAAASAAVLFKAKIRLTWLQNASQQQSLLTCTSSLWQPVSWWSRGSSGPLGRVRRFRPCPGPPCAPWRRPAHDGVRGTCIPRTKDKCVTPFTLCCSGW